MLPGQTFVDKFGLFPESISMAWLDLRLSGFDTCSEHTALPETNGDCDGVLEWGDGTAFTFAEHLKPEIRR